MSPDSYPTRLWLSSVVQSKAALNWNADGVAILQKTWFAYSWADVQPARPMQVLAQHLKAFA